MGLAFPALMLICGAAGATAQASKPDARRQTTREQDARLRDLIPPAPALHPSLKGDVRLSKAVTVAMGDVPMADLLAELAKLSGVPLTASSDVADDMVIAGFKNHPLGSVLSLLSTHFGFTWRKKAGGYELWQDLASKQREEALRNEEIHRLISYVLRLGKLAERPFREIYAQAGRLREAVQDPQLTPEQREQAASELRYFGRLSNDELNFALRLLARAPAARLKQLVTSGDLNFSASRGDIRPVDITRWLVDRAEKQDLTGRSSMSVEADDLSSLQVNFKLIRVGATNASTTSLRIEVRHRGKRTGSQFGAQLAPRSGSEDALPTPQDDRLHASVPPITRSFRYPGSFRSGPYLAEWRRLLTMWPETKPSTADLLLALHAATKLDLLSDSFRPWRAPHDGVGRPPATFDLLLKDISRSLSLGATIEDDVLRLRQRDFFNLRPATVPVRLVREAASKLKPDLGAYLNAITDLTARLDRNQSATLLRDWGYLWATDAFFAPAPELHGPESDLAVPAVLARISPGLKRQLLKGDRVALGDLSRADSAIVKARMVHVIHQANVAGYAPLPDAGQPVALVLRIEEKRLATYSTYDSDGRATSVQRRPVQTDDPAQSLPAQPGGESPVLVGEAYTQTNISLQLVNVEGRIVQSLGSMALMAPCPYQVRAADPGPPQGRVPR